LDVLVDAQTPDEMLSKKEMRTLVLKHMNVLEPELKTVISMAFGFNNQDPIDRAEISRRLRCSKTRADRLLKAALAELRLAIQTATS
jgi:DNA-directed RNA polymerase sigma subunit (sigma70/sigma32)